MELVPFSGRSGHGSVEVRLVFRILVIFAVAETDLVDYLGFVALDATVGHHIVHPRVGDVLGLKLEDEGHFGGGEAKDFTVEVVVVVAASAVVSHKGTVVVLRVGSQFVAIDFVDAGLVVVVAEIVAFAVLFGELGPCAVADADGELVGTERLDFDACHKGPVGDLSGFEGGDRRGCRCVGAEGGEGLLFTVDIFGTVFGVATHVVACVGFQLGQQASVGLGASEGVHGVVVDGGALIEAPADAQFD